MTFTFMHLADAFIQSDLQCIQAIYFFISMSNILHVLSYEPQPEARHSLEFDVQPINSVENP